MVVLVFAVFSKIKLFKHIKIIIKFAYLSSCGRPRGEGISYLRLSCRSLSHSVSPGAPRLRNGRRPVDRLAITKVGIRHMLLAASCSPGNQIHTSGGCSTCSS